MDGIATFVLPAANDVSFRMGTRGANESVECPVQRLVTTMNQLGHTQLDLLKIDIEGAEYAVIDDMLQSRLNVRQFLVEFHHRVGDRQSLESTRIAIEELRRSGFRLFSVSSSGHEYSFIRV